MLAAVPFTASERLAAAVGEWFASRSAHADREDVGDRLLATRMIINELELGFARDRQPLRRSPIPASTRTRWPGSARSAG